MIRVCLNYCCDQCGTEVIHKFDRHTYDDVVLKQLPERWTLDAGVLLCSACSKKVDSLEKTLHLLKETERDDISVTEKFNRLLEASKLMAQYLKDTEK